MEEGATRGPQPNEFVIAEDQAYALTSVKAAEIAEFLLTKLEAVEIETLDADDRTCTICLDEFHTSEDVKLMHTPVKMVCGHVYGGRCIVKWLDPLCYWAVPGIGLRDVRETVRDMQRHGKTSCPNCRTVFFPKVFLEPMELLAARLFVWDFAYFQAGVARSEKEAHTRKFLWGYVKYCHLVNDTPIVGQPEVDLLREAQLYLLEFAIGLESQELTPVQEGLRNKLERIAQCTLKIDPELEFEGDRSLLSRAIALEGEFEWLVDSTDVTIKAHGEEKDDVEGTEGEEGNRSQEGNQSQEGNRSQEGNQPQEATS